MNTRLQNRIILLAEDSDDDAFFFERAFTLAGLAARLVRVANGGEAVEFLEQAARNGADLSRTHLVFLDLKMPVLNGFEVLRLIRERGIAVEVVVLSGSNIESDMEQARSLGASDYLVKPITSEEIKKQFTREKVAD
jgi:CheY-like chemotaxis protein